MGAKRSERSRTERIRLMEDALYNAASTGLTTAQLVKQFNVDRTTIWRDIRSLEREEIPIWASEGRFGILLDRYISKVRLNLHEATALFLAARLLTRYADSHHPHVARGIEKLAAAMPKDLIQQHMRTAAAVVRSRRESPDLTRNLERLTEAWAERKRVRLWQADAGSGPAIARLFDPYFIEPSGVGYSLYVIGLDHARSDFRTFHIGRLKKVELTEDRFEPQVDFNLYSLLKRAWGINWGAGGELQRVRLRFPPGRITARVKSSEWHMSQRIEDLPDGGCVLEVAIGDCIEMKPFIRQWGKDCEVLAPADLRAELAAEMRAAAAMYASAD